MISVTPFPYRDMQRIVLAHGVFDLLHLGHIRHLQEAKSLGDRLIVSVTDDPHVNKGIGRPHFSCTERMEALRALDCVDQVIVSRSGSAIENINAIKPAVYVKGVDYADDHDEGLQGEKSAVEAVGGRLHITHTRKWSSSRLINAERFDEKTQAYLDGARRFLPAIREALDKAKDLKVLFVGEPIIDEYRYVRTLNKSSKEPLVATVYDHQEEFHGGVWAASYNAKAISPSSSIIPCGDTVITKTRYVSADYNRKLFEVYSRDHVDLDEEDRSEFHGDLKDHVASADVVVAIDFGHGLINNATRAILQKAKFLAVNAQSNSANYGFNPVTKWLKANYVCVDAVEARLAVQDQTGSIEGVIKDLADSMECRQFIVTHGYHGTITLDANFVSRQVPVFATEVVDTIGAGDAFLAVTAPLIAVGLELEAAAIVGNVAGAIKVGIVGHRRSIQRDELVGTVESLLK